MRFCMVLAFMGLCSTVHAESLCLFSASAAEKAVNAQDAASAVRAKCRVGDVIVLPPKNVFIPGLLCDFGKSIISGPAILCVLGSPRDQKPADLREVTQ